MTQESINRAEWENPRNWAGPRLLAVYYSKKDSRLWVPKRIESAGWTMNMAKSSAMLMGVAAIVVLVTVTIVVLAPLCNAPSLAGFLIALPCLGLVWATAAIVICSFVRVRKAATKSASSEEP